MKGSWPADLADAGYQGGGISGKYVESVEVRDGSVFIQYGREANRLIAGHALSLHPASADGDVVWSCGYAAPGMGEMPAGTDVPEKFLPRTCRSGGGS